METPHGTQFPLLVATSSHTKELNRKPKKETQE